MAEEQLKRWAYTARNAAGELISGTLSAESEIAAAKRLQAMGLAPLSVRPRAGRTSSRSVFDRKIERKVRVRAKHLAMFARQFTTMINAGLPLVRALSAMIEQTDHPELRKVLPIVRADVQAGRSLSQAFARHEEVFPALVVGMVGAGEVSGDMHSAFAQIAENYDKEAKLRSKIVSAMTYPVIVLSLAVILVTGMLVFIVPRFEAVFKSLGGELPWATQMLIAVSRSMVYVVPIMLTLGFMFTLWWRKNRNERRVRAFIDPLKLRIPVFGKFFQKIAVARFSRTLASLLNSGVPILQSLEIVATTAGSYVISRATADVRDAVRGGRPVHSTMSEHKVFPPLVNQMIATGEETGALPEMLNKVAEYYEREVDTGSDQLGSLIEPMLLIVLALIVGSMVLALYMPIFSVFQLVQAQNGM